MLIILLFNIRKEKNLAYKVRVSILQKDSGNTQVVHARV